MKQKRWFKKAVSGMLTVVTLLSTVVAPLPAMAAEISPEEKLAEYVSSLPQMDAVADQLDSGEQVTADTYEVETGAEVDLKVDFTNISYDGEKVKVSFYEAKNEEGQDFSSSHADTYKAIYYAEPISGNPAYKFNRTVIVKEPAQTQSQTETSPGDSGGGQSSDTDESEDADADSESQMMTASEAGASGTEADTETEESSVIYEFSEEAYALEMEAAAETVQSTSGAEQEAQIVETEAAEEEPSEALKEETADEIADPVEPDMTEGKDGFQVNITKGEELGIELNHADGIYEPGETVSFSTDLPAGTLTAVAALKEEANETDNTEDLLYSEVTYNASKDLFSFEMPAEDIALEVQRDAALGTMMLAAATSSEDSWDDATEIEANKYYYYSDGTLHPFNSVMGSGGNDSYKYVRYKVGGKTYTVNAYCMQHSMSSPPSGTTYTNMIDLEEGGDDKYLRKALFYGYGGPGWGDTFNGYNIKSIMTKYGCTSETRAMQHYLVDYLYDGESGFGGALSDTAKNMLKEIKAALKEMPDPSAIELKPGLSTTATGLETETFTWKANEAFVITIHLEDGVSLVNETTGKTGTGNVKVKGGEKFHLVAQAGKTGSLKGVYDITCNYPMNFHGMLLKLQNSQDIGFGYYTDGDDIQLTVSWPERAKVEIIKEDGTSHAKLAGAVYGIYSDAACKNLIVKMPATDSKGASAAEFDVAGPKVYLKELTAPKQYKISVSATGVSVSAGNTSKVTLSDEEIMGSITVYKEGEVLTGAKVTDSGVTFQYEKKRLAGATYQVTAGADIIAADGTLVYQKGAVVAAKLTTNKDGEATLGNLHLGSYVITETGAPKNYINQGESKKITLSESDPTKEIVLGNATFTNDRQKVSVVISKVDDTTKNPLPGGIYGLYAAEAIKNVNGDAIVAKDTLIQKATTGADGKASFTADLPLNVSYYVKELQAPKKYVRNEKDVFTFKADYTNEKETVIKFTYTFENERVNARIDLTKVDAETGAVAQGDATLEGATYGLYAREDIVHPDGKTGVLYKKDSQIATLTTDKNGKAFIEDLYLGKYYIKELVPSEGYLLDGTEYDLDCADESDLVKTVKKTATSKEQVIKQPFQVIKAANNGKTDADLLSGVGFTAYLISSLKVNADGTYDFAKAEPIVIAEDGKTEMFTDGRGHAQSIPIPYGKYIVRETTTPHNFTPVDDFIVTITENHPTTPQVWRVLLDDEFEAKLKIVKKDDETKKSILLANTEFKVYDMDNEKYVEQVTTYPETKVHKSYFTDANGYLILPNNLSVGHYRIEEVNAPEGYTLNTSGIEVLVDSNTAYQMDSVSGDAIITVEVENHPVKGRLVITKKGEVLKGYDKDFSYEETTLAGAEFAVYAAEDIYTPDHQKDADGNRIVIYAKDAQVASAVTNDQGEAVVLDLPLGKYYVKETKAPYGFVLNREPQAVAFAYQDQDTPVIEHSVTFTNDRQKVSISVEKQDAENGNKVSGATFGLYAKDEIMAGDQVLVKADTLLEEAVSGDNGIAAFTLDLPLGTYYVKETKAPAGFVSSDEVIDYDASYQGQDIPVVKLTAVKKNEPTTFEFTKSDITTGVELDGATLTVMDGKGNVIDTWTSVKGEPHVIKYLTAGESYVLREEFAPYGYLKATDVSFTVEDTAEIQKVEMKDEVPTALLIINKKGEFLDKVSLLDNAKGTVEHLFEYITGNLTEVTFEVYAAEDIHAADGVSDDYYKKDDLIAEITTDENGIAKLGDIPVGKYYVKEVGTAYGYVLDEEPRYVDLSYRDQDTPVVVYDENWQNNRQKVAVNVLKVEKETNEPLQGGIFGLFAAEDIKSASGKTLIEKDTIIELKTTDAQGKITFIADLPVDGKYYVQEQYAPAGYVTTNEKKEFTFSYGGETEESVVYDFTFENEPTTVEFSKTDITTGKEIPGAHLEVRDEDGNLIDEWVSEETPHIIQKLEAGKEYSMTETLPADGYVTAETIIFKVENTTELQHIEMKDDVTKVEISKTDMTTGKELPGAKLTILDKDGNVVESWISEDKPHYIERLPIGDYTLREETAPDGYLKAEDVKFSVKDTSEIQKVEMKDAPDTPKETPGTPTSVDTPKTGDDSRPLLWAGLAVLALLALIGSVLAMKKNKNYR